MALSCTRYRPRAYVPKDDPNAFETPSDSEPESPDQTNPQIPTTFENQQEPAAIASGLITLIFRFEMPEEFLDASQQWSLVSIPCLGVDIHESRWVDVSSSLEVVLELANLGEPLECQGELFLKNQDGINLKASFSYALLPESGRHYRDIPLMRLEIAPESQLQVVGTYKGGCPDTLDFDLELRQCL